MGYMGFGMQKWIYSRSPRKPFVKSRIPSFTSIDTYDRTFKVQPSKSLGSFFVLISILLLGLFFSMVFLKKDELLIHSNEIRRQKTEILAQMDIDAFKFLLKSGKYRLETNNISGAYSEFKLAYKINPDNNELNVLLSETLSILCYRDTNTNYCDELDNIMKNE